MDVTPNSETPPPSVPPSIDDRSRDANALVDAYLVLARARLQQRESLNVFAAAIRVTAGSAVLVSLLGAASQAIDLRTCAWAMLGVIVVGTSVALRGARERSTPEAASIALAEREPDLADELRTLLQLRARAGRQAFVLLLAERVASNRRPILDALPITRAKNGLLRSLLLSISGLLAIAIVSPRLLPDAWLTIRRGPPASGIVPGAAPIVGDLELELRPPPYTGLPPRTIPASSGDLRALRGTEVIVRARSLVGAVRKVELRLEPEHGKKTTLVGTVQPGERGLAATMKASFFVDAPGAYRFVLSRWTGRMAEPNPHRIDVDADVAPRVDLRAPADPLELEVVRPVELAYEVEDDFGIDRVELVYRIGEGKEHRKALEPERPSQRRARGRLLWELGELERDEPLPQGSRVSYWIEAHDNDEVSGKKLGRSRAMTVVIRGKPDPAKVDREQLEALLEAALGTLADRLEGKKDHAKLAQLALRYQTVAGDTKGKATAQLARIAGEIAVRLQKLVDEEARADVSAKIVTELEHDVLALDDLRGRRRLEEMVRLGDEMKRARDQLKRLFAELKTATSDEQKAELKREIERKLTELEAKMAELKRVAAEAEGEVPDEFLNRDALAKQQVRNDVDGIRQMLAKGNLEQAAAELERMSHSLDEMTSSMSKDLNGFKGERNPAEEKALAELQNDLADLSREEREIEKESRAIQEKAAQNAEQHGGSLKQLRDKLKPKLAELDKRLAEQQEESRFSERDTLDRIRSRAHAIDRALESNDLDDAQNMALDARRMTGSMSEQMSMLVQEREAEAQARVGDGPSPGLRRSSKRMAEAESIARDIESELNRVDNARNQGLGEGDKKRLDELSRRQRSAAQRGEELQKRMAQQGQPGMSGLPQGVRGDVDGARQSIGESGRQLSRSSPGRGAESAGDAAQKLDSARKQVQEAQRGEGGQRDGADGERRDEPVRIPGADDSAAPRAFREELLDAMKRGAPKRFEEQVQKYYEDLVK